MEQLYPLHPAVLARIASIRQARNEPRPHIEQRNLALRYDQGVRPEALLSMVCHHAMAYGIITPHGENGMVNAASAAHMICDALWDSRYTLMDFLGMRTARNYHQVVVQGDHRGHRTTISELDGSICRFSGAPL